jgi:hypothetical protein
MINLNIGDEVVVKTGKRYFRANVTETWPDKYDGSESEIAEIEYDSLFGTVRELINTCYIYGVKHRVKEG